MGEVGGMRLLVLGGTSFLGRSAVDLALAQGHNVTTFNRGQSGKDDPRVEAIRGDRTVEADLDALRADGRSWDFVIDTSGYVPRVVGESARALEGRVGSYVFVSSISALEPHFGVERIDDNTPATECPPDAGPDDGTYGPLKAGCERAVVEVFG